ncbi:Os03g0750866 [Oryza sativa Japonica Group]|uniref:Os03g0750866 protein n=1 Tax=Oryza sativa subsp. japonica TaxID=39947 RepID=A0A0P0W319_ORYSJ|nr:Os03g0750866 [Oryza sativa Japonica Group]
MSRLSSASSSPAPCVPRSVSGQRRVLATSGGRRWKDAELGLGTIGIQHRQHYLMALALAHCLTPPLIVVIPYGQREQEH